MRTRLVAIAIEWIAFTLAGIVGFFAFVAGFAAALAIGGPEFFKMNVPPVNVLAGGVVAGAVAIALVFWADRHRRGRVASETAAGTGFVKVPTEPLPQHTLTQKPVATTPASSAMAATSLDVIKAQILQLLRQPRVLQSAVRFQRSDLVMALAQQGFREDHPDLESLVENAVSTLLAEGRLEEQGDWLRARSPAP